MLSYDDAVRELYGLASRGVEPGLDRMRRACALAGDPQARLGAITHVAGTNGKGSIAAMVARGVVGQSALFTSPHLHRLLERFRTAPEPVAPEAMAEAWRGLRAVLAEPLAPPLTFFETVTLLAFRLFAGHRPDVTVLEVGLGGRLDSTNVVERRAVTVVSRVHLDHQRFLGETIGEVAREKAGILERRVPVIIGRQMPAAEAVIRARAEELDAPVIALGHDLTWRETGRGLEVRWGLRVADGLRPRLLGPHQRDNVALAVAALWCLAEQGHAVDVDAAVHDVAWPGRLEAIDGAPRLLLDGAHNPDAAETLAAHLDAQPSGRRVLLFATMADKDWRAVLGALRPRVDAVVVTQVPLARAEAAKVVAGEVGGEAVDEPLAALARARELAGPDGLVVVAGSLFLVAAIRAAALGLESDPPIAM